LGVEPHPHALQAWWSRHEIGPRMPPRAARARDPVALARWVTRGWPPIKKSSSTRRAAEVQRRERFAQGSLGSAPPWLRAGTRPFGSQGRPAGATSAWPPRCGKRGRGSRCASLINFVPRRTSGRGRGRIGAGLVIGTAARATGHPPSRRREGPPRGADRSVVRGLSATAVGRLTALGARTQSRGGDRE
jgi:hypothetical protein